MALVVGGVTVTGTQTLDASKLTGTASAINGSNITNLPASAPSSGDVGTATAGLSYAAVGTYALVREYTGSAKSGGNTSSGSNLGYTSADGQQYGGTRESGTWRCMGRHGDSGAEPATTVYLRIS